MDENKYQSNIGSDNEEIFARRKAPQNPPRQSPSMTPEEMARRRRVEGLRSGQSVSQKSAQRPVRAPVQTPAQRSAQRPGQTPAQKSAQRPGQTPVQRPVQRPAQDSVQRPAQTPVQRSAQTPVQRSAQTPVQRPTQQGQRPVQNTAQRYAQQGQRPAQNPAQGQTQRSVQNPAQIPVQQSAAYKAEKQGIIPSEWVKKLGGLAHKNDNVQQVNEEDELIPTGRKKIAPEKTQQTPQPEKKTLINKLEETLKKERREIFERKEAEKPKPPVEDNPKEAPKDKAKPAETPKEKKKKDPASNADIMSSVTKALIYMVIVTAIAVLMAIVVIRVGNDVFAFVKGSDDVVITIPENASVSDVADILGGNGIINYPSVFKIYCNLKHESGDFLAGEYTVNPSMSYEKLRGEFKEQPVTGTSWITIPEGYTVDDIIDLMVENNIGTRERYIDVINNYDFDYWFIDELNEKGMSADRSYRLEGYLFPDTYELYNSSSEEMVINKLLKRFNEVYNEDFKAKAAEIGYTTDQVLTIASFIQKEAKSAADYMYVSSVIDNRLNNPNYPHLELDATIVYAVRIDTGEKKTTVNHEDTLYKSPYNTYICNGLTPGPITNPGANAIRFALYPAPTDYYYYVSDNGGRIYYASTKAQHDENIEMVKLINES